MNTRIEAIRMPLEQMDFAIDFLRQAQTTATHVFQKHMTHGSIESVIFQSALASLNLAIDSCVRIAKMFEQASKEAAKAPKY
jgi:hypothetical protein